MAKFNAAEMVAPLEYDLTAFQKDPDETGISKTEADRRRKINADPTWAGTIPEPSEDAMRRFFASLTDINLLQAERDEEIINRQREAALTRWRAAHPGDDTTPSDEDLTLWDSAANTRANMTELAEARTERRGAVRGQLNEAVSGFCSGHPSVAVVGELPWRGVQTFSGWLAGEFSPEALAAAMRS